VSQCAAGWQCVVVCCIVSVCCSGESSDTTYIHCVNQVCVALCCSVLQCGSVLQCVAVCCSGESVDTTSIMLIKYNTMLCESDMGWLCLVGSLKTQVSFAEYSLFYTALLQKRPMFLGSRLIVATPYHVHCVNEVQHNVI